MLRKELSVIGLCVFVGVQKRSTTGFITRNAVDDAVLANLNIVVRARTFLQSSSQCSPEFIQESIVDKPKTTMDVEFFEEIHVYLTSRQLSVISKMLQRDEGSQTVSPSKTMQQRSSASLTNFLDMEMSTTQVENSENHKKGWFSWLHNDSSDSDPEISLPFESATFENENTSACPSDFLLIAFTTFGVNFHIMNASENLSRQVETVEFACLFMKDINLKALLSNDVTEWVFSFSLSEATIFDLTSGEFIPIISVSTHEIYESYVSFQENSENTRSTLDSISKRFSDHKNKSASVLSQYTCFGSENLLHESHRQKRMCIPGISINFLSSKTCTQCFVFLNRVFGVCDFISKPDSVFLHQMLSFASNLRVKTLSHDLDVHTDLPADVEGIYPCDTQFELILCDIVFFIIDVNSPVYSIGSSSLEMPSFFTRITFFSCSHSNSSASSQFSLLLLLSSFECGFSHCNFSNESKSWIFQYSLSIPTTDYESHLISIISFYSFHMECLLTKSFVEDIIEFFVSSTYPERLSGTFVDLSVNSLLLKCNLTTLDMLSTLMSSFMYIFSLSTMNHPLSLFEILKSRLIDPSNFENDKLEARVDNLVFGYSFNFLHSHQVEMMARLIINSIQLLALQGFSENKLQIPAYSTSSPGLDFSISCSSRYETTPVFREFNFFLQCLSCDCEIYHFFESLIEWMNCMHILFSFRENHMEISLQDHRRTSQEFVENMSESSLYLTLKNLWIQAYFEVKFGSIHIAYCIDRNLVLYANIPSIEMRFTSEQQDSLSYVGLFTLHLRHCSLSSKDFSQNDSLTSHICVKSDEKNIVCPVDIDLEFTIRKLFFKFESMYKLIAQVDSKLQVGSVELHVCPPFLNALHSLLRSQQADMSRNDTGRSSSSQLAFVLENYDVSLAMSNILVEVSLEEDAALSLVVNGLGIQLSQCSNSGLKKFQFNLCFLKILHRLNPTLHNLSYYAYVTEFPILNTGLISMDIRRSSFLQEDLIAIFIHCDPIELTFDPQLIHISLNLLYSMFKEKLLHGSLGRSPETTVKLRSVNSSDSTVGFNIYGLYLFFCFSFDGLRLTVPNALAKRALCFQCRGITLHSTSLDFKLVNYLKRLNLFSCKRCLTVKESRNELNDANSSFRIEIEQISSYSCDFDSQYLCSPSNASMFCTSLKTDLDVKQSEKSPTLIIYLSCMVSEFLFTLDPDELSLLFAVILDLNILSSSWQDIRSNYIVHYHCNSPRARISPPPEYAHVFSVNIGVKETQVIIPSNHNHDLTDTLKLSLETISFQLSHQEMSFLIQSCNLTVSDVTKRQELFKKLNLQQPFLSIISNPSQLNDSVCTYQSLEICSFKISITTSLLEYMKKLISLASLEDIAFSSVGTGNANFDQKSSKPLNSLEQTSKTKSTVLINPFFVDILEDKFPNKLEGISISCGKSYYLKSPTELGIINEFSISRLEILAIDGNGRDSWPLLNPCSIQVSHSHLSDNYAHVKSQINLSITDIFINLRPRMVRTILSLIEVIKSIFPPAKNIPEKYPPKSQTLPSSLLCTESLRSYEMVSDEMSLRPMCYSINYSNSERKITWMFNENLLITSIYLVHNVSNISSLKFFLQAWDPYRSSFVPVGNSFQTFGKSLPLSVISDRWSLSFLDENSSIDFEELLELLQMNIVRPISLESTQLSLSIESVEISISSDANFKSVDSSGSSVFEDLALLHLKSVAFEFFTWRSHIAGSLGSSFMNFKLPKVDLFLNNKSDFMNDKICSSFEIEIITCITENMAYPAVIFSTPGSFNVPLSPEELEVALSLELFIKCFVSPLRIQVQRQMISNLLYIFDVYSKLIEQEECQPLCPQSCYLFKNLSGIDMILSQKLDNEAESQSRGPDIQFPRQSVIRFYDVSLNSRKKIFMRSNGGFNWSLFDLCTFDSTSCTSITLDDEKTNCLLTISRQITSDKGEISKVLITFWSQIVFENKLPSSIFVIHASSSLLAEIPSHDIAGYPFSSSILDLEKLSFDVGLAEEAPMPLLIGNTINQISQSSFCFSQLTPPMPNSETFSHVIRLNPILIISNYYSFKLTGYLRIPFSNVDENNFELLANSSKSFCNFHPSSRVSLSLFISEHIFGRSLRASTELNLCAESGRRAILFELHNTSDDLVDFMIEGELSQDESSSTYHLSFYPKVTVTNLCEDTLGFSCEDLELSLDPQSSSSLLNSSSSLDGKSSFLTKLALKSDEGTSLFESCDLLIGEGNSSNLVIMNEENSENPLSWIGILESELIVDEERTVLNFVIKPLWVIHNFTAQDIGIRFIDEDEKMQVIRRMSLSKLSWFPYGKGLEISVRFIIGPQTSEEKITGLMTFSPKSLMKRLGVSENLTCLGISFSVAQHKGVSHLVIYDEHPPIVLWNLSHVPLYVRQVLLEEEKKDGLNESFRTSYYVEPKSHVSIYIHEISGNSLTDFLYESDRIYFGLEFSLDGSSWSSNSYKFQYIPEIEQRKPYLIDFDKKFFIRQFSRCGSMILVVCSRLAQIDDCPSTNSIIGRSKIVISFQELSILFSNDCIQSSDVFSLSLDHILFNISEGMNDDLYAIYDSIPEGLTEQKVTLLIAGIQIDDKANQGDNPLVIYSDSGNESNFVRMFEYLFFFSFK